MDRAAGRHRRVCRCRADEADKDSRFHYSTGGGRTVSGGECLLHPGFCAAWLDGPTRAASIRRSKRRATCRGGSWRRCSRPWIPGVNPDEEQGAPGSVGRFADRLVGSPEVYGAGPTPVVVLNAMAG